MVCFPNAKINIGLYVVSKRNDGYHNIETVMVPVSLCDILEIVPGQNEDGKTELFLSGNKIDCPKEKNLVYRATELIRNEFNIRKDIKLYLRKIIPDQAGLGGGSSDASFTLILMNKLFNLNLSKEELSQLAAKLGADCPFFIYNKPLLVTGIGDIFEEINIRFDGFKVLILKPLEAISTKEAYSNIIPCKPQYLLKDSLCENKNEWKKKISNDFEGFALKKYPNFKEFDKIFRDTGAFYWSMSGSGTAFYGIYPSDSDNLTEKTKEYIGDKIDIFECNVIR